MADDSKINGPTQSQTPSDGKTREFLAITVTLVSLAGALALGFTVILIGKDQARAVVPKDVLSTMLPLLGTWVGTVLAFYFSKANFEAAAQSVAAMAKQVSGQDKLKTVPVQSKMITRDKMFFKTDPVDGLKIADVLKELETTGKGDRIPVLTKTNAAMYIIHRSILDRYLADKGSGAGGTGNLIFTDLFTEKPDFQQLFARSFATVKADATLADAQTAMESVKDCEDVFVTSQGGRQDEVVGWITDNIIQENLKV